MIAPTIRIERRQLRAPRENGASLIEPPLSEVGTLVAENVRAREQQSYDFQGRSLAQLTAEARADLVRDARHWTAAYRDVDGDPRAAKGQIFLAGHQPQLFHPGVWFKNFVLGHLARQQGGVAVNLQIDSDTIKSAALRVPGGSPREPRSVWVPFDQPGAPVPYEERRIASRPMFAEFGRRAAQEIAALLPDPLLRRYWPLAVERSKHTDNLGACLAQSRHQWEGQWGVATLEVPQSCICQSPSFAYLVAHLLAHLPRFRQTYNEAVGEYRTMHGIRNAAHPVPDLGADGPWLESPFWIWTARDPVRRPLFACQQGREVRLSDRRNWELALPLAADAEAGPAVTRLLEASARGVKIRSRALITTLWARLVLGDVFLHGIGGAKYDQVTDAILERFFGLRPPGFVVVSATLLLPTDRPAAGADELRAIDHALRELTWHPERHLETGDRPGSPAANLGSFPSGTLDARAAELIAAKQGWIQTIQTPENSQTRFRAIRQINQELQPWIAAEREQLLRRRQEVLRAQRAQQVLAWREYGFCLYPEGVLRDFLFRLLPKTR